MFAKVAEVGSGAVQRRAEAFAAAPSTAPIQNRVVGGLTGQAAGVIKSASSQINANLSGRDVSNAVFAVSTVNNSLVGTAVDLSSDDDRVIAELTRRAAAGLLELVIPGSSVDGGIASPIAKTPTDFMNEILVEIDEFSAANGQDFAPALDFAFDVGTAFAGGVGAVRSFATMATRQGLATAVRTTASRTLSRLGDFTALKAGAHVSPITGRPVDLSGRIRQVKPANGPTRFTPLRENGNPVAAGIDHVRARHFGGTNSQSQFSVTVDELKTVLQSSTVRNAPVRQIGSGRQAMFARDVDVGRVVGRTRVSDGANPTSTIRVFVDEAGNLITTFPIPER